MGNRVEWMQTLDWIPTLIFEENLVKKIQKFNNVWNGPTNTCLCVFYLK